MIGTLVGHYRITAKLGEGGMGAVYRATDTKLNRDVAVKVLTDTFASDGERLARFTREAQVLASLNHPNIASIYGVEERALIMELVEGAPLAGPLPPEVAIAYAKQIAVALEAAHEKGIVHRDLKPANVMVTPDGVVKVLDFGLAKAAEPAAAADPSNSPTLTMRMTEAGLILGTAAYMAPEQARGKAVDKRADIWAFGVVLFEMLTGKTLFGGGETVTDTLAAVVLRDPDLTSLPPETPPRVRRLIERCLHKDPKLRLRDIGEARILLEEAETPLPVAPTTGRRGALLALGGAAAGAVAGALGVAWWKTKTTELKPLLRLNVDLGSTLDEGGELSPDGTSIAHRRVADDGTRSLVLRRLGLTTASELSRTGGGPFFSPDGQWVAYVAGTLATGELMKISVQGGAPIRIGPAHGFRGGYWGPNNIIVFGSARSGGQGCIYRIPASGGTPEPIAEPSPLKARQLEYPQLLPDGDTVLFTVVYEPGNFDGAATAALSIKSGKIKTILPNSAHARCVSSGHLVFLRDGALFAARFNANTLELSGTPALLVDDLIGDLQMNRANPFSLSRDGMLLYRAGVNNLTWPTVWLDRGGKMTSAGPRPAAISWPRLSPDGKKLAGIVREPSGFSVWSYDLERDGTPTRVADGIAVAHEILWFPDGKRIAFSREREGGDAMFAANADGSGTPQKFLDSKQLLRLQSFTPDGGKLVVFSDSKLKIVTIETASDGRITAGKPEVLWDDDWFQIDGEVSPDGRWIAYSSLNAGGGAEQVLVRPLQGVGPKVRITTLGGKMPRWSKAGKELFYRAQDERIMIVAYTTKGDTFQPGLPELWSPRATRRNGVYPNYDVAPDGKRIITFPPSGEDIEGKTSARFTVLLNFFDELERRTAGAR